MEQLIRIETVPISYELKINKAKFERQNSIEALEKGKASHREPKITSGASRGWIDVFDVESTTLPNVSAFIHQEISAVSKTLGQHTNEGRLLLQDRAGNYKMDVAHYSKTEMDWLPPALFVEYEMDKLNFDMRMQRIQFEYIPGDIEMVINQYPEVNVEYVGKPIYVPPGSETMFVGRNVDLWI